MKTHVTIKIFEETDEMLNKVAKKLKFPSVHSKKELIDKILTDFRKQDMLKELSLNGTISVRIFKKGYTYRKYGLRAESLEVRRELKFLFPYVDTNLLLNTIIYSKLEDMLRSDR